MNTEVNTDNVALTQRLSSKTTKNYYTGGTFPAIPSREEFHRYASNILNLYAFETDYPPFPSCNINAAASSIGWTKSNNKNKEININLNQLKILLRKIINNVRW